MVLSRMGAAAWRLLTDVRFAVVLITLLALADYEPPPLDEAVDEELREWVARAKASFPDSNV